MPISLPFTKMHSLGNDFVLFEKKDLIRPLTAAQIRWITHRRHGVGCDQVIVMKESLAADREISFYNADGGKALACGNGTRCVAHYLGKKEGTIQTPSFLSRFWKKGNNIQTALAEPTFKPQFSLPTSFIHGYPVEVGNPHLVIFTKNIEEVPLEKLALSLQPPEGVNIEVAQVTSSNTVKVRVWERGVGITPACGSGACAVGTLSLKLGLIKKSPVRVEMEGGVLGLDWQEGTPPLLTGPAEFCFKGIIEVS